MWTFLCSYCACKKICDLCLIYTKKVESHITRVSVLWLSWYYAKYQICILEILMMHNIKLSGFNKQKTMDASSLKRANADITTKVFTFGELAVATQNFHPKKLLGKGGFGRLYKGQLTNNNKVCKLFCFSAFALCIWSCNLV